MSKRNIALMDAPIATAPEIPGRYGLSGNGPRDGGFGQNIDGRLSRIEGQMRGIRSMAAERRACVDVITQISAVRAALKKVSDLMVTDHVERWLREAAPNGGEASQDVEELLTVFRQYYR